MSNTILERVVKIAPEDEIVDIILKINDENKITKLLNYIIAFFNINTIDNGYSDRARILISVLTINWHNLDDNENQQFLSTPFDWHLLFCIEAMLKHIEQSCRFRLIESLLRNPIVHLSTTYTLLFCFEERLNRFTEKVYNNFEPLLTLEEVMKLEKIFVSRVIEEIETRKLIINPYCLRILWLFEKIDEEVADRYTDTLFSSDLELSYLISSSVFKGKGASNTVFSVWNIDKEILSKYCDYTTAYEKMIQFANSEQFTMLSEREQENIIAFLVYVEKERNEEFSLSRGVLVEDIIKRRELIANKG